MRSRRNCYVNFKSNSWIAQTSYLAITFDFSDPKVVERIKRKVRLPAAIIAATFIETMVYDTVEIALPGNVRQGEEDGTSPDH